MRSENKLEVLELERRRERRGVRLRLHVVQTCQPPRQLRPERAQRAQRVLRGDHLERPDAEKDLGIEMRTLGRGHHPPPDRVPPLRGDLVRRHGLRRLADRDLLQVLQLGELLRVVVDRRLPVAAYPAQTRPDQKLDLVRVCAIDNVVLALRPCARVEYEQRHPERRQLLGHAPHRIAPIRTSKPSEPYHRAAPFRKPKHSETEQRNRARYGPRCATARRRGSAAKPKMPAKATSWSATRQLQVDPMVVSQNGPARLSPRFFAPQRSQATFPNTRARRRSLAPLVCADRRIITA